MPANGEVKFQINFGWQTNIVNNAAIYAQFNSYAAAYDRVMIKKMRFIYWLDDNDELSKADHTWIRHWKLYDPDGGDAAGSSPPYGEIRKNPKAKMVLMKPGTKYFTSFSPKWEIRTGNVGETPNAPRIGNYNGWCDINSVEAAPGYTTLAANCVYMDFVGAAVAETNFLRWYVEYEMVMSNRRQTMSTTAPASAPPIRPSLFTLQSEQMTPSSAKSGAEPPPLTEPISSTDKTTPTPVTLP